MQEGGGGVDFEIRQDLAAEIDLDAMAVLLAGDDGIEAARIGRIGDRDIVAGDVEEPDLETHLAVEKLAPEAELILRVLLRRRRLAALDAHAGVGDQRLAVGGEELRLLVRPKEDAGARAKYSP